MSEAGPWRIGAVVKMIGVPAPTLRTWERRYGVVDPGRTDGQDRLYDADDVERLRLIEWLRERGERVADLARLSQTALTERKGAHEPSLGGEVVRVVVLAEVDLPLAAGRIPGGGRIAVVARAREADDLPQVGTADVAVLDLHVAGDDPVIRLRALQAAWNLAAVVVVHGILPRAQRVALMEAGARLIRSPVDPLQLSRMLVDLAAARGKLAELTRAPRFPKATLQNLANRPVTLACECPNQLAALLLQLSEFEQYSRACASRSAADKTLHQNLANGTARARMITEELLIQVCVYDGIALALDE